MKTILAFTVGLLLTAFSCNAQLIGYKSLDGLVFLSKSPDQYFTFEVNGKEIKQIDPEHSPHPYMNVDGRFLQVLVVSMDAFKGDPSKTDAENLKLYLAYEKDYWKDNTSGFQSSVEKLSSGHNALAWSYTLSKALMEKTLKQGGTPSRSNEMLTIMSHHCVLTLGSVVQGDDKKEAVRKFLMKIAESFQDYDTPQALKFFPDGHYERQPEKP